MGNEAIVIPIIIDPKSGVAGLKAVGEQAEKTGRQFDQGSTGAGKFSNSMKGAARNMLAMLGAMNLAQAGVRMLVQSFIDMVSANARLVDSKKILLKVQDEAVASMKDEAIKMQSLLTVARNTELSYNQRQGAIEQMLKMYPELQSQLSLEKINTEGVTKAVNGLVDSLVRKAKADLLIKQIAELETATDKLQRTVGKDVNARFLRRAFQKDIDDATEGIQDLKNELNSLMADNSRSSFGSRFGKALGGLKDVKLTPDKLTITPKKVHFLDDIVLSGAGEGFKKGMQNEFLEIASRMKIKIPFSFISPGSTPDNEGLKSDYDDMIHKYEEMLLLNQRLGEEVGNFLAPAFADMFNAILEKQDALKAFFNAIGQSIKKLMVQLIEAAIRAAALSLITGGAAGGGLSFAGAFKKIFGFAGGGLVTGPVSALVGEGHGTSRSNPEVVAPLDRLQSFFRNMAGGAGFNSANMGVAGSILKMPAYVEVRQRGRDMVGTITLEQAMQGRTG
ncbi:MAG: hypothetical protein ACT4OJ_10810 [Bacteroidota bacterium]